MSRSPSLTVCPLCFPLSLVPASGRAVCASRRGCFPASPASVRPGLLIAPGVLCPVMISGRGSGEYGKLYGCILWGGVAGGSPPYCYYVSKFHFLTALQALYFKASGAYAKKFLFFPVSRFLWSDFAGSIFADVVRLMIDYQLSCFLVASVPASVLCTG